jgi:hypothetical protein
MGVARAALERVKEQFTGLASRTELIPEAGFPAAGGLDNASTASPRMQIIAYMATRDARIVSQIEREGDLGFRVDPLGAWFIYDVA